MKKVLGGILCLSLSFALISCKKKRETTKGTSTKQSISTTKSKTTTNKITSDNPEYKSDYSPIISNTLPRIDINTEEGAMDWYTSVTTDTSAKEYVNCNVVVTEGDESTDALAGQVKVRGNWTITYPKKPLRIKFEKKQAMLGLNNGEKYESFFSTCLNTCFLDIPIFFNSSFLLLLYILKSLLLFSNIFFSSSIFI